MNTSLKFGLLTALYQEFVQNEFLPKLNDVNTTKRFLPGTLVECKGKKAIVYGDKAFEAIDDYSEVKIGILKDG